MIFKEVAEITFPRKSEIGYRNLHQKNQLYIFNRDQKHNTFIARQMDKNVMYINKSRANHVYS